MDATAQPELTECEKLKAAQDWAHSIQARFAEKFSGLIARASDSNDKMNDEHRDAMRDVAVAAGMDESVLNEMFKVAGPPKLGEFDEPKSRYLIQRLVDDVTETMTAVGLKPGDRKLLVSSLPSGLVNAFCCASTWDQEYHHVFVDSDLLIFSASLAKIVSNCFTRNVGKAGELDFRSPQIVANARHPDVSQRIEDLFAAGILLGTVRASRPWLPDPEALALQMQLTEAMERFVIAHELSHLMLGHLDSQAETVRIQSPGFEDTDAIVFSQEAEFQADAAGAIIATETAVRNGRRNALTSIAPYIFLKGIEVLDACNAPFEREAGGIDSTHPSAKERLAHLRAVMIEHIGAKDPDGNFPHVMRRIDQLFFWIGKRARLGIAMRTANGVGRRERVGLRLFEAGGVPRILGFRLNREEMAAQRIDIIERLSLPPQSRAPA